MPNRKTHKKITIASSIFSSPIFLLIDPILAVSFEFGVLLTTFPEFSPDLDSDARKFNWLGKLLGMESYAKSVPHRLGIRKGDYKRLSLTTVMKFSHIPLFGTFPRFLIIAYPVTMILMLVQVNPIEYWVIYLCILLGMSYSDFWHSFADIASGEFYRKYMRPSYWARRFWYGITTKDRRRLRR